MVTNDFLPLGTGGGANVQSQVAYAAEPLRPLGNQPGVAVSAFNNKALRQVTYMVAALAQFMCNTTGDDVLDDATQANVLATMAKIFTKSPTITKYLTGSGTYTVPAAVQWLRVRMVGAGAGGSGTAADGVTGGNTTFGAGLLAANGGSAAAGGTASLGAAIGTALSGGVGRFAPNTAASGGDGAGTPFGDGGIGAASAGIAGVAAAANTGAGGGGSTSNAAGNGIGGGSGGYVDAIIAGPLAATYAYAVGAGGASGFTALNGSYGADGYIEIEEHYN